MADPQYNNGIQGPAIARAIKGAKERVAEKAAAEGSNIIQYNRKRCDELGRGAVFREVQSTPPPSVVNRSG